MIVSLTPTGERLFGHAFAAHLDHLRLALGGLGAAQLQRIEATLRGLRETFESAAGGEPTPADPGRKAGPR
jgi:DNA-binding MarR family transcriptional regulator